MDDEPLIRSIANSLALGLIDNVGIANALSNPLQAAQDAANGGQKQTAINIVRAFENELNAQTGEHITGIAPQVLLSSGKSKIIRRDGDRIYVETVLPDAQKNAGCFNLADLRGKGDFFSGTVRTGCVCQYTRGLGEYARTFSNRFALESTIEITKLSPTRICGKFVQVSKALTLGAPFTAGSYSVPHNSTQYHLPFQYKFASGNWYLFYNGTEIGYYPGAVYLGGQLTKNSTLLEFGSESVGTTVWPAERSGQFGASYGYDEAAWQRNLFYINTSNVSVWDFPEWPI